MTVKSRPQIYLWSGLYFFYKLLQNRGGYTMNNLTVAHLNAQLQTLITSISDLDEESIRQIQNRLDSLTKHRVALDN